MANPTAQEAARRLLVLGKLITYAHAMPPLHIWSHSFPKCSKEEQEQVLQEFKKLPKSIADGFKRTGLGNDMSTKEDTFLHTYPQDLSLQDLNTISWRKESAIALMWALGMLSVFPSFDSETDLAILNQIPRFEDIPQFIQNAKLRSPEELESKRSLAQSWHWRSRTRELIEEDRPFPIMRQTPQFNSFDDVVRFSAKALKEEGALAEIINEDFPAKGKAYRDLTGNEWLEVRSVTMERHFALNWLCGYAPGNRWDATPTET
jgi:hypothetical protein